MLRQRALKSCSNESFLRTAGEESGVHFFCLAFARGCCEARKDCLFLHRLPCADDEHYHSLARQEYDMFGRPAGLYTAEQQGSHTLYVNYEGAGSYSLPDVRELILNTATPWGEVASLRIIHHKTIAFLSYSLRTSAEFALEVLQRQGLTGSTTREVLEVRWARPSNAPREVRLRQARAAYMASSPSQDLKQVDWTSMTEEQQQTRIAEMRAGGACKRAKVVTSYPNTDGSFRESEAYSRACGETVEGNGGSTTLLQAREAGGQAAAEDCAATGSSWGVHHESVAAEYAGAGGHDAAAQAYYAWWCTNPAQCQQQQWGQEWAEDEPAPPGDDSYLLRDAEEIVCCVKDIQGKESLQMPISDQTPVSTLGSLLAGYSSSDDE